MSGLTRASIANIESGRQRVLLHQILQFAEALGVDLATLVPRMSEIAGPEETGISSSRIDYLRRLRDLALPSGDEQSTEWKS